MESQIVANDQALILKPSFLISLRVKPSPSKAVAKKRRQVVGFLNCSHKSGLVMGGILMTRS